MKIALIAPPFIPVPPVAYGGTELFLAQLAGGLARRGHDVILYANGASTAGCDVRWMFPDSDWPPGDPALSALKSLEHTVFAMNDAAGELPDVLHANDAIAVPFSRLVRPPFIHTLHHPHEPSLSTVYSRYPHVRYVAISAFQRERERMPDVAVVHHGIALSEYPYRDRKEPYVCFLGRIAPIKGTHLAIEAALLAGVRLKIAGEIQPIFRDYWESAVRPHVDGKQIEYVGEANQAVKKELLGGAAALLFPIQWNEPFGLVMIEAMACGTPVLALPGGAVPEVVKDGVSGFICRDVAELAARAACPDVPAASCRAHVEAHFTVDRMVDAYEALYRRCEVRHAGAC
jgi:glycosyltransferase involved in cell wall biosynthesis